MGEDMVLMGIIDAVKRAILLITAFAVGFAAPFTLFLF